MLMFASGIVGSSEVKLRQQKGFPEGVAAIVAVAYALLTVCASRL